MSNIEDLRAEREKKVQLLQEQGMNPYPSTTRITHKVETVLSDFTALEADQAPVTIGGRIMAFREHGAIAFMDILDGTGKIQGFCSKEALGEEKFDLLLQTMSTADFIEVTGTAYITKRGTQAVLVKDWTVLGKALQSIPTEHFVLKMKMNDIGSATSICSQMPSCEICSSRKPSFGT